MSEFYGEWSGDEENETSTITNEKPEIKEIKQFIKNNTNQKEIIIKLFKEQDKLNKNNITT